PVLPAPVLPAPVLPAPVLPAPVLPAPGLPVPVLPGLGLPAPVPPPVALPSPPGAPVGPGSVVPVPVVSSPGVVLIASASTTDPPSSPSLPQLVTASSMQDATIVGAGRDRTGWNDGYFMLLLPSGAVPMSVPMDWRDSMKPSFI